MTYLNWFAERWILGLVCFFSILYLLDKAIVDIVNTIRMRGQK